MIELYTAVTPNGWRTSIALAESGLTYVVRPITLTKGERKEERAGSCQPVVPSLDPLESRY
jgi:glutathione S-transferase